MERKAVGFEQLSDIFGFRVVVGSVVECYQALGIVHTTWPVVPGRFKDYISTPKQNDYRSIHSTVIGPGKQRVELQIRTREMHQIAEYGIAAHALYKDDVGSPTELLSRELKAYAWLRRTIELLAEGSNPEEFLEHTKLELFQDQVFCFTPKGKLIALPRGATPIDFAYAVHTDVGNMAVGAKINGQIAPLELAAAERRRGADHHLEGADSAARRLGIDRRDRQGAGRDPARDARGDARAIFRARPPHPRAALPARQDRLLRREAAGRACTRLARASIDDVMSAVGRGEMKAADVVRAMYPDYKDERVTAPRRRPRQRLVRAQARQGGEIQAPGEPARIARRYPDPRHQYRPAGALRSQWRGRAGRPHRRHHDAGRRHHHLPDPLAGADRLRG